MEMEERADEEEGYAFISDNLNANKFTAIDELSPESEYGNKKKNGDSDGSIEDLEESFVLDFYRSKTDCSCLLERNPETEGRSVRKLKQTNLLQLWGLKKPEALNPRLRVSSPLSQKTKPKFFRFGKASDGRGEKRCRVCPFYKKIPGTPFTVDAFNYGLIEGCSAYFLSHFHSDHYGGLSKAWSHGPIYCTHLTARLVRMCLLTNPLLIRPLELNTEYDIEGVKVTLLDANHCPGAAMIHFCLGNGQCYLHTGDFRACRLMQSYSLLASQRVNVLYLDTTYCNPKYRFPSKEDVLSYVVRITRNCLKKQPKTLVVVGAYSIGKECVYLAISEALGVKIYASASRRRILQSFGWPELSDKLCSHGDETPLHVVPISSLQIKTLKGYMETYMRQYSAILAFRPTGWTYSNDIGNQLDLIRPISKDNVMIYGVPYSEHSSFLELREFVQFVKPGKIIPTVNIGNAANRDKMKSYFREWLTAENIHSTTSSKFQD